MPSVEVKIKKKTGEMEISVDGVEGGSCLEITKGILEGNEIEEQNLTECYEVPDELPDYVEVPTGE